MGGRVESGEGACGVLLGGGLPGGDSLSEGLSVPLARTKRGVEAGIRRGSIDGDGDGDDGGAVVGSARATGQRLNRCRSDQRADSPKTHLMPSLTGRTCKRRKS